MLPGRCDLQLNVCFSNRAAWSSSYCLMPVSHSRGSRFSSQSGWPIACRAAARMCRIGVESLAYGRAQGAADIFGFIHPIVRVRTIPAGSAELSSDHAAASLAPRRNSLPSTHMRCKTTANLRATATRARRRPLVFISRTPQAFKLDHAIERVSMAFAAA